MDNITHTLVGIGLADALTRKEASPRERKAVFWASVLGNNIPDSDVLYHLYPGAEELGYLLHHRGITHTFLLGGGLGLACGGLAWFFTRKAEGKVRLSLILFFGVLGSLFHLFADFWNDYGIHPFWPFSGHWVYGDFVFIIEPLLWAILMPWAFLRSQSTSARVLWGMLVVLLLGLCWFGPFLTHASALGVSGLLGLASGVYVLSRRSRWGMVGLVLTLLGSLSLNSVLAKGQVQAALSKATLSRESPAEDPVKWGDLVFSPAPGRLDCFRVIAVGRSPTEIILRVGTFSWRAQTSSCHPMIQEVESPPLQAVLSPDARVFWFGEWRGSLARMETLAASKCRVDDFLKFARAPFWIEGERMADLRYESGARRKNFAQVSLREEKPCISPRPPWEWPIRRWF